MSDAVMTSTDLAGSDASYVYCDTVSKGVRIALVGEIDIATVPRLDEVFEIVTNSPPSDISVDLSAATFIDSTVLGYFIRLNNYAKRHGHQVELVAPTGAVARVLRVSHFDRLFAVAPARQV